MQLFIDMYIIDIILSEILEERETRPKCVISPFSILGTLFYYKPGELELLRKSVMKIADHLFDSAKI